MAREREALRRAVARTVGRLTTNEERLLLRLFQYSQQGADGRVRHEAPTVKLALELGIGVSTVERARRRLIRLGLLAVEGGTGRRSYQYRVVVPAGLSEELNDAQRYPRRPPHFFHKVKAQGLHLSSRSKEPGARSDSARHELHPSPTATPRGSCRKHRERPGISCRACGTSPRHRKANPRASGSNPRAGYVTYTPPPYVPPDASLVGPPAGFVAAVRATLAAQRQTRRYSCA